MASVTSLKSQARALYEVASLDWFHVLADHLAYPDPKCQTESPPSIQRDSIVSGLNSLIRYCPWALVLVLVTLDGVNWDTRLAVAQG